METESIINFIKDENSSNNFELFKLALQEIIDNHINGGGLKKHGGNIDCDIFPSITIGDIDLQITVSKNSQHYSNIFMIYKKLICVDFQDLDFFYDFVEYHYDTITGNYDEYEDPDIEPCDYQYNIDGLVKDFSESFYKLGSVDFFNSNDFNDSIWNLLFDNILEYENIDICKNLEHIDEDGFFKYIFNDIDLEVFKFKCEEEILKGM